MPKTRRRVVTVHCHPHHRSPLTFHTFIPIDCTTLDPVVCTVLPPSAYYYPTAKKRYLPRILQVSTEIATVPGAIAAGDWERVTAFGATAANAVLPLQLYQSSLGGQGLSLNNSYAQRMKEAATRYQAAYAAFAKAVLRRDAAVALQAVIDMGLAVQEYRQEGRLADDDGNIPSVDEIRRMSMRLRRTDQFTKSY